MYINPESIQLDNIQDLLTLTLYKPKTRALPGDGYVLAEDLVSKDKGGILYAKGMELDYDKIERLLRLRESNPDWDLSFVIQKNEKLTETLNKRVKADFVRLMESRKARNEYRRMMEKVGNTLDN